eukprot:1161003-Pelagomonas_calceolata.AAC.11
MPNMVTDRYNIACRMILKLVNEGSYGANLVQLDAGTTNCLAQHDLQVPEQISNHAAPSYLFKPIIPIQTRRNSSRPDAILVTPHPTNPKRPLTPPSHRVLRSMGSSTTPARHIHLIEVKYCEDTRPSAQVEASQQQHSELCKQPRGAEITNHPSSWVWVGLFTLPIPLIKSKTRD